MVFFLAIIVLLSAFFNISLNIVGYFSVDKNCCIFVVKAYGLSLVKMIINKENEKFVLTINGEKFDKPRKKTKKNFDFKKIFVVRNVYIRINSNDIDAFGAAMIEGALRKLPIKKLDVKTIRSKNDNCDGFFNVKINVSLIKGVKYGRGTN